MLCEALGDGQELSVPESTREVSYHLFRQNLLLTNLTFFLVVLKQTLAKLHREV
jgi:hypothetical protein